MSGMGERWTKFVGHGPNGLVGYVIVEEGPWDSCSWAVVMDQLGVVVLERRLRGEYHQHNAVWTVNQALATIERGER